MTTANCIQDLGSGTMIHYLYFAAVLTLKQRAWTARVQRSGDCLSKDQTAYLTTRLTLWVL